jgi:hypothetical protein
MAVCLGGLRKGTPLSAIESPHSACFLPLYTAAAFIRPRVGLNDRRWAIGSLAPVTSPLALAGMLNLYCGLCCAFRLAGTKCSFGTAPGRHSGGKALRNPNKIAQIRFMKDVTDLAS